VAFRAASSRRFRIRPPDRRARDQLARTGRTTITVDVWLAGRISLVASARIGGHTVTVARTTATVHGARSARLGLRLSAAARAVLRRRGRLRMTLVVRHARLGAAPAIAVTVRSTA
jgi:hypothetical protein